MKKHSFLFICLILLLLVFVASIQPGTAAGSAIWSDNFDSYPTGANMHGVGGWKGWFNDPTFTAFSTDVQAWDSPNSVDIKSTADLVHELSANSGLVNFRFYQYIPGNFSGTSYFIMLNQYDDLGATLNWSVQVQHQSNTGLIVDDGGGGSMPYIPDQWVEVCLEINLTNDTQAYFYNNALLYTGTWSGHISGGGITAIGAVDLFANNATSVYYDHLSLDTGGCPRNRIYLPLTLRP